ncbi:hypothetical protein PhCBS80983_g03796 [Powellomyces hirtus]|uniref:glycogenin glucosyltransferase n=1 Tax=Powellomyces hirtus TaxID=109895 RepID=A0A507E163_9FUNG|nr:hypothetical protein PhCBS80983_g03796 [Powellomyces hirtus]
MPGTTSNNRNAYATLLTSDSYLPGALVLASSLRATITRCPLICLVPENALSSGAHSALEQAFDQVITVPMLRSSDANNLALLGRAELDVTYTKLHVFNPQVTGCDKVAFMDADVMITRNVDALFDYLQEDVVFAAAPDIGWPDCFNSGVFVCKPRLDVFQGLVRMAATTGSFDGGDQGVLNDYFSGWASGVARPGSPPHRTARLPFTYNVTPTSFYSYLPALVHFANDISAVHFIGTNKPWTSSREPSDSVVGDGPMQQFLSRWWNFYDAVKHVYKSSGSQQTATATQKPTVQHNNWTSSGNNTAYNPGSSRSVPGSGGPQSDNDMEFSNYRVSWNEHEASPVRSTFSMTPTPFVVTYRATQDDSDAVFFETEQPTALFPNAEVNLTPVSPDSAPSNQRRPSFVEFEQEMSQHHNGPAPPSDLGNYRVGWNQDELGPVAAHLVETPGNNHGTHGGAGAHWHKNNTDLHTTALGSPAAFSDSEADNDGDEDEMEDDRVWNEDADQELFVQSLKAPRPRSASRGSQKSVEKHIAAPVPHHAPTSPGSKTQKNNKTHSTAPGALAPLHTR